MFRVKSSPDQGGKTSEPRPIEVSDVLDEGIEVRRFLVQHLNESFSGDQQLDSPLKKLFPASKYVKEDWIASTFAKWGDDCNSSEQSKMFQCLRAGQREKCYWNPKEINAAIVNCGGLCPGLNSVIREVTMMLHMYGIGKVYGIIGGYKGVLEPENWIELNEGVVNEIHLKGGSYLVSDRGNPPHWQMAEMFRKYNIRQVYIIGGDGTHKGATTIYEECVGRQGKDTIPGKALDPPYECSIVGIPKTIDNDIAMLDYTFGFHSAVTEAVRAIDAAYVESSGNANCLGLVKLMGRSAGFIACWATLAARHVDLCLIPEMSIDMNKVLDYIEELQSKKHNAVVVIAEGLGDTLIQGEGFDAGGNKKLADVGPWFKKQVEARFKEKNLPLSIKYIDPSYQVRAVPPDPIDSEYCSVLAQNAVHGAMAGYTGFCVGQIDTNYVMLPIQAITEQASKTIAPDGRIFARMCFSTKQPSFEPDGEKGRPLSPKSRVKEREGKKLYLTEPLGLDAIFTPGDVLTRYELQHLNTVAPGANVPNPLGERWSIYKGGNSWASTSVWKRGGNNARGTQQCQFLRSGPRRNLYWDPKETKAAIVNCGGICPGLNSVIRELVMMLDLYGCKDIYGIIGGYKGVMEPEKWIKLSPKYVEEVHLKGGSFLVSDRGNPPHIEMAKMYQKYGITHVYVIGGDGTHKGIMQTYEQMLNIGYKASLCGVPKTIDNDIALLDYTFGFHTAVNLAVDAITSAYTEATCNANCMGLVKLMGRHAGFIATHASIAARHVDLCLISEMDISMDSVKAYITETMEKKGYCVVVIAEGLGDTLIQAEGTDAGGNKTLADVGPWFKKQIEAHMKKVKRPFTCKYIDPSYIIRSTAPNNFDSIYCSILAQQAVHGCFAGYTGFSVGKIANHYVMLPIDELTSRKSRTVDLGGHWYARLVYTTRQPSMKKKEADEEFTKEMDMVWQLFKRRDSSGTGILDKGMVNNILIDLGMPAETASKVLTNPRLANTNGKVNCKNLVTWIFQGTC